MVTTWEGSYNFLRQRRETPLSESSYKKTNLVFDKTRAQVSKETLFDRTKVLTYFVFFGFN